MYRTIEEYNRLAIIVLNKCHRSLVTDENIGIVASAAMSADQKFNGEGSRDGYRVYMAKFYARKLFTKMVREKRKKKKLRVVDIDSLEYDLTDYKSTNPYHNVIYSEVFSVLEKDNLLSDKDKKRFISHYKLGMTNEQIAQEEGNITKQAINLSIHKTIKRLRELYEIV